MTIQKGQFVKIDYTGKTTDGIVFDTTVADKAKQNAVGGDASSFEPRTVCVGEQFVLAGVDASLAGKKKGETYSVTLQPEEAFGKKNAKLIQLISQGKFKSSGMQPQVGLQVTVDNQQGVVRRVGGGRVLVDFNHPLAGIPVEYEITVVDVVEDPAAQVAAVMKTMLPGVNTSYADGTATFEIPMELDDSVKEAIAEPVKRLVSAVNGIAWTVKAPEAKPGAKKEAI